MLMVWKMTQDADDTQVETRGRSGGEKTDKENTTRGMYTSQTLT